jgi:hypothetical protein
MNPNSPKRKEAQVDKLIITFQFLDQWMMLHHLIILRGHPQSVFV